MEYYNKSIQLSPKFGFSYLFRAEALHKLGKSDQALDDYAKGFSITPKGMVFLSAFYLERASIFGGKKMYKEALSDCAMAIELSPKEPNGYRASAEIYFAMEKYDETISNLTSVIELNPKDLKYVYWRRGLSYYKKGMIEQALRDVKTAAAKIDAKQGAEDKDEIATDKAIYLLLSELYIKKKDYRKAIDSLNTVIGMDQNLSPTYALRGQAYLGLNQIDKAMSDYEKSCDLGYNGACEFLKAADEAVATKMDRIQRWRILQPGDYINYKVTGSGNINGGDVSFLGTAEYKVLSDTQTDYYGNKCKVMRMSMDLMAIATVSKKQGRLKRTSDQYFTQDINGSLMYHGTKKHENQSLSFVKTPLTGWYYGYKTPLPIRDTLSQHVVYTDGKTFDSTDMLIGEEQVSIAVGIFKAFKSTSNGVMTYNDSRTEQGMETTWVVPEIGPMGIKRDVVLADDKKTMRLTLEMVDTNIPYRTSTIGTYIDPRTGLMWATKDNGKIINWHDAKAYCENYRVGGFTDWRLPTQKELEGLYDKSIRGHDGYHLPREITLTGCCLWASETRRSDAAYFNFFFGERLWFYQFTDAHRALPVRSGK